MARQELVKPYHGPLATRDDDAAFDGADADEIWQGYRLRWTRTGLEITAPTSRRSNGPLWVGGAAGLVATFWLSIHLADIENGQPLFNPPAWAVAAYIGFAVMSLIASPFYLLPGGGLRSRGSGTLEIRPDGITVNRKSFFPRHWIHRIGIEWLDGAHSDYPYGVVGIIGTRRMELLGGFDSPTAEVVGAAVERAKRQLWQEAR